MFVTFVLGVSERIFAEPLELTVRCGAAQPEIKRHPARKTKPLHTESGGGVEYFGPIEANFSTPDQTQADILLRAHS